MKSPRAPIDLRQTPWGLTPCEYETMRLTVEELLDATQIARRVGRSCKTIRAQRESAKQKMGASSLLHAALLWDRHFRGGHA